MRKTKEQKGITLVALIITIIVLLILAVVAIGAITNDGIISKAKQARDQYGVAQDKENSILQGYLGKIEENLPGEVSKKPISKTESFVGYYADVDGNGSVDGVIYADLAVSASGEWSYDSRFSYEAITGTKDYYVSETNHNGVFGTKDVLVATGEGLDRFYVMALENFNAGTQYCWYDAAGDTGINDLELTSMEFGTGRTNTETMIEKWNSSAYGPQNDNSVYEDIWGVIQDEVAKGWFIPSVREVGAFGWNLGINGNNSEKYGLLSGYTMTSSLSGTYSPWHTGWAFSGADNNSSIDSEYNVRLSTTF